MTLAHHHVNQPVMEANAWRVVFGRKVTETERGVVRAMAASLAARGETTLLATDLTAAVVRWCDVSRPTAEKRIQQAADPDPAKGGFLCCAPDETNATRVRYRWRGDTRANLERLGVLLGQIARVLEAQAASPEDPFAGIERLDAPEIYFNISAPDVRERFEAAIADTKHVIKHGKAAAQTARSTPLAAAKEIRP